MGRFFSLSIVSNTLLQLNVRKKCQKFHFYFFSFASQSHWLQKNPLILSGVLQTIVILRKDTYAVVKILMEMCNAVHIQECIAVVLKVVDTSFLIALLMNVHELSMM